MTNREIFLSLLVAVLVVIGVLALSSNQMVVCEKGISKPPAPLLAQTAPQEIVLTQKEHHSEVAPSLPKKTHEAHRDLPPKETYEARRFDLASDKQWLLEYLETLHEFVQVQFKSFKIPGDTKRTSWLFALKDVKLPGVQLLSPLQNDGNADIMLHFHRPSCLSAHLDSLHQPPLIAAGKHCPQPQEIEYQRGKRAWGDAMKSKVYGACPSSALLECKRELNKIFSEDDFFPKTYYLGEDRQKFLEVAHKDPKSIWFLKSQNHGKATVGDATQVISKITGSGGAREFDSYVAQRKLEDPFLYHGRVTSARAYVTVTSHAPLRAYITPSVQFIVAPGKAGSSKNSKCHEISNLANEGCSDDDRIILVYNPIDTNKITKHPITVDAYEYQIKYVDVELPDVLWKNLLHMVRTVLIRVDKQSGIINEPCTQAKGKKCSTLFGFDFFTHEDFSVSLMEVNALPSIFQGIGHVQDTVDDWSRLVGGVATNRSQYLKPFKNAVKTLCASHQCTKSIINDLLKLADERWGKNTKVAKALFPTSTIDDSLQIERHFSSRDILVTDLSSQLLKMMGAFDDADMSNPVLYKTKPLGAFLPQNGAKIIFAIGTEDAKAVHTPLLRKAIVTVPNTTAEVLRTFSIGGSGDQFLTMLRAIGEELSSWDEKTRRQPKPRVAMDVVDGNPRQVELAAIKYHALQSLSREEMILFLFDKPPARKEDKIARGKFLSNMISKAKANVPIDEAYWMSEVKPVVEDHGLLATDVSSAFWAENVKLYTTECKHLSTLPRDVTAREIVAHIGEDKQVRLPCFLNAVSKLPYMFIAPAASGWPLFREVGRSWLKVCHDYPNSWFCVARFRLPFSDVLPPWMSTSYELPKESAAVDVSFWAGDVVAALEKAKDHSYLLIDLTNLISCLPVDKLSLVTNLVARKLHPRGVCINFIGPMLSGGVCHATGGDTAACADLVISMAYKSGLEPDPHWSLEAYGESFAEYVIPLQHKRVPATPGS